MSTKLKKCVIIPLTDRARAMGKVAVATFDNGGLRYHKINEIVYLLPSEIRSIERRKERQKGKSELTVYQIMESKKISQAQAIKVLEQLKESDFENTQIDEVKMFKVDTSIK